MLTTAAIILLIFAAVFFLALNLFKSLTKAISISFIILFILGILTGYLIIKDAREFATTMNSEETTYLLQDGNEIITGFSATRLNLTTFKSLENNEIEDIREDPQGKIFIIKKEILNLTIDFSELTRTGLDIDSMLESDSTEVRAQAFVLALGSSIEEQGVFEMVLHIKEKNIIIEPKTPVVFAISATPRQLYKQAKQIVISETNDKLNLIREKVSS